MLDFPRMHSATATFSFSFSSLVSFVFPFLLQFLLLFVCMCVFIKEKIYIQLQIRLWGQQRNMQLPSALFGLSLQSFSLKPFFYFFLKKPAEKVSYIFSKKAFLIFRKRNFLIFRERYIRYHGRFRTRSIFRTLAYSEPEAYSDHCQTSTMERFALVSPSS